jgi:hypothetical protein
MLPDAGTGRPLQVALFGKMFATVVGPLELSASGPDCVRTLALQLLQSGLDPDRRMIMYRANQRIGSTTIAAASQRES